MKSLNLILILVLLLSCKDEKKATVKPIEISFTKEAELIFYNVSDTIVNIDIEIAESDYEQQTGLMHRSEMEMNQGMLFIYEDERPRPNFYMKNTKIPLDLIYINANKQVVEIKKNAKPLDETPIGAEQPAQYVLEVNAGFANQHNINTDLYVNFKILNK
jgi:uncharacterized membrane protein (UPF0127 family)